MPGKKGKENKLSEEGKPYRWKKGQSGNPSGMPAILPELHGIPKITKREVELTVSKLLRTEICEIKKMMGNEKEKTINVLFAAAMLKAIQHGDTKRISDLLDRLIGKIAFSGELDQDRRLGMKDYISIIPDEQLIELAKNAVKHEASS